MPEILSPETKNDVPREKETSSSRGMDERLLPGRLVAARRRAGLSQKAAALSAGLNQSFLCALERGRRPVPSQDLLETVGKALRLDAEARAQLQWAAKHDLVLQAVADARLDGAAQLVAAALQAAEVLTADERHGLALRLMNVRQSKRLVLDLRAEAIGPYHGEEAAMD